MIIKFYLLNSLKISWFGAKSWIKRNQTFLNCCIIHFLFEIVLERLGIFSPSVLIALGYCDNMNNPSQTHLRLRSFKITFPGNNISVRHAGWTEHIIMSEVIKTLPDKMSEEIACIWHYSIPMPGKNSHVRQTSYFTTQNVQSVQILLLPYFSLIISFIV